MGEMSVNLKVRTATQIESPPTVFVLVGTTDKSILQYPVPAYKTQYRSPTHCEI